MTTTEYKRRMIEYFKSNPSDAAYEAMAEIVSDWTEGEAIEQFDLVKKLHTAVFGPPWECVECGELYNWWDQCWSCDSPRPATDAELDSMIHGGDGL